MELAWKYNPPRNLHARESVLVPPNRDVRISLEMYRYERMNRRNRPCETVTGELIDFSKLGCYYRIFHQEFLLVCNCSLLGFEDHALKGSAPVCPPWQMQKCQQVVGKAIDSRTRARYAKECEQPCKEIRYRTMVTYSDLDGGQIGGVLNHSIAFTEANDYYKIHLYYQELMYTSIMELDVLGFNSIVTGFGGLLSLYLGANLVNLSRAIVFFLRKATKKPTRRLKNRTVIRKVVNETSVIRF